MTQKDIGADSLRPSLRRRLKWQLGQRGTAGPLLAELERETRAVDRRVRATIRASTRRSRAIFPVSLIDGTDLTARARLREDERGVVVECSVGVALAIDDLALFAATMDSFLIPTRSAFEVAPAEDDFYRLAVPVETAGAYRAATHRFHDYSQVARDPDTSGATTFAMPLQVRRLLEAQMLAELALAWVLLHEYGHWGLVDLPRKSGEFP